MIKVLILIFLGYIAYRVLRKYIIPVEHREAPPAAGTGSVDEMVQDPFCNTYVPRRTAIRRIIGGREYFFCSEACADRFESKARGDGEI
jgi:uncharacterized protein